jgi:hypothetical protein
MRLALLVLSFALAASAARAVPVPIANAGFEDLYLGSNLPPEYGGDVPTGSFPTGPPPAGWSAWYENGSAQAGMFLGVLNPGTTADHAPDPPCFPDGAPEGDNVVLVYMDGDAGGDEYGVEQALGVDLAPHTVYTLTVEVGDIASCAGLVSPYQSFFDLQGFPSYRVQLLAGGEVVAEDPGMLAPGDGNFATTVVTLTTGAVLPVEGALAIRLVNRNEPDVGGVDGLEVDFDDVRLDATPVSPVPALPFSLRGVLVLGLIALGVPQLRRRFGAARATRVA